MSPFFLHPKTKLKVLDPSYFSIWRMFIWFPLPWQKVKLIEDVINNRKQLADEIILIHYYSLKELSAEFNITIT